MDHILPSWPADIVVILAIFTIVLLKSRQTALLAKAPAAILAIFGASFSLLQLMHQAEVINYQAWIIGSSLAAILGGIASAFYLIFMAASNDLRHAACGLIMLACWVYLMMLFP